MKNFNEMYDNKKNKKELKSYLKREFLLATKDESFIKLCNKLDMEEDKLINYTSKLEESVSDLKHCKNCKGLGACKNKMMGYYYYPKKIDERLDFSYVACKYKMEEEKNTNDTLYFEIPISLKNAKMSDIIIDNERKEVIKYASNFIKNFPSVKGLYLHGNFGSGKSYIISAIINELSKEGKTGVIVYYPKLITKLKSGFSDNCYTSILEEIMNSDVLLLDDIGAENNTSWSRDEILGSILQHRMDNELPTFFTSNLSLEELETHLSNTNDKIDKVKARRIIERIKFLTNEIELVGKNRRN